MGEHRLDPSKLGKFDDYRILAAGLTYFEARSVEQAGLNDLRENPYKQGIDVILNQINSISPNSPFMTLLVAM